MKSGTRDQAEGTFHQIKGKVKEVAGELSDNPKLEAEGTGDLPPKHVPHLKLEFPIFLYPSVQPRLGCWGTILQ